MGTISGLALASLLVMYGIAGWPLYILTPFLSGLVTYLLIMKGDSE